MQFSITCQVPADVVLDAFTRTLREAHPTSVWQEGLVGARVNNRIWVARHRPWTRRALSPVLRGIIRPCEGGGSVLVGQIGINLFEKACILMLFVAGGTEILRALMGSHETHQNYHLLFGFALVALPLIVERIGRCIRHDDAQFLRDWIECTIKSTAIA